MCIRDRLESVSHTTCRYYVVLVIHFIDETYLKVTPLPIYEVPNPYIPQPCHSILVFLHLSNLGRRLPFASQLPPADTYVVMPTRLLGLPLVLWLTTIKFAMVLHALHKHCHRYGLPSIIGYDSPIHRCLLLETNRLHIPSWFYQASHQHTTMIFLTSIIGFRLPLY